MNTMSLRSLVRLLAPFDHRDIASGVGALCLMPENAHALGRLEVLAAIAVTRSGGTRRPDQDDWVRIVVHPALAQLSLDEPAGFGNPYLEEIPFIGGVYRALPGPVGDARYQLQRVLATLFGAQRIGSDQDAAIARAIAIATLRLGEAVAHGGGLTRMTTVPADANDTIHIPDPGRFGRLQAAVTYDAATLREALGGIDPGVFAPITRQPTPIPPQIDENTVERVRQWPLLEAGGRHIVVLPHAIVGSITRALVDFHIRRGYTDAVRRRYREAIVADASESLRLRLGVDDLEVDLPTTPQLASRLFTLDDDARLHLMVASDDLAGYGLLPIARTWRPQLQQIVDERTRAVEEIVFGANDGTYEILHLLVVQAAGRETEVAIRSSAGPVFSLRLVMLASELDVFSRLPRVDAQTLRQFVRAANCVRERTVILRRTFLDEFQLWRAHKDSYYLDDERRYDTIGIQPGGAEHLRLEVQNRQDRHGAIDWEGRVVEVRSYHDDPSVPIYAAVNRASCLLVEGLPLQVWIELRIPRGMPQYASMVASFADSLAYWIWQCSGALEPMLRELSQARTALRIAVEIVAGPGWRGDQAASIGDGYTTVQDVDGFVFRVDDGAVALLERGDNAGDRVIVTRMLEALVTFGRTSGLTPARLPQVEAVRESVAPLGTKKHLLLHPHLDPQHHPGDLPSLRLVQDAHEATALDLIRVAASARRPAGEITSRDERIAVLNESVDVLMKAIATTVATLSPEGVLEALVVRVERLIYEREHARIVVPTRIACYGGGSGYAIEVQRRWQESVIAFVATRFLIEYVVAQPPVGARPVSTFVLDELVAYAAILINLGKRSDVLHYKLGDVPMRVLPAGRLGFRDDAYATGTVRYVGVANAEQMERAAEELAGHWSSPSSGREHDGGGNFLAELDGPAIAEFGCSLTELLIFLAECVNAGSVRPAEAKVERLDIFAAELAAAIPWPEERVRETIERFALGPRDPFKPKGKEGWHVYPWRYQRPLAYLRRPLLLRDRDGAREVVWGNRHVLDAGTLITGDCRDGRYQARTPALASAMGALRNRAGAAFAEEVGEVFRAEPRFIVETNVRKFGKLKPTRANGEELGDFDVLVADRARRRLRAIEVKNLTLARTPVEEQHLLESIFVGTTATRSDAARHRERCTWLAANLRAVLDSLDLGEEDPASWTVEGLIALNEASSAPYVAESLLPVYSIRELRANLGVVGELFASGTSAPPARRM